MGSQCQQEAFLQAASNRPELGRPAYLFDHDYERRAETIDHNNQALNLLGSCNAYIDLEQQCSSALYAAVGQGQNGDFAFSMKTCVLDMENSIADAVTGGLTTAMCYMATFLVNDRYLYSRWMDSGSLQGFVSQHQAHFHAAAPSAHATVRWQVLTDDDLSRRTDAYNDLRKKKVAEKPEGRPRRFCGRRWDRLVKGAKSNQRSVDNALTKLVTFTPSTVEVPQIKLLGIIVHIDKAEAKEKLGPQSHSGYHVQSGIYEACNHQDLLNHHVIHHTIDPKQETFHHVVQEYNGETLILKDQERIINLLSNDPALAGRNGMCHSQYFSTGDGNGDIDGNIVPSRQPTAMRTKVLYFARLRRNDDVIRVLNLTPQPKCDNKRETESAQEDTRKARRVDLEHPVPLSDLLPTSMTGLRCSLSASTLRNSGIQ